MSSSAIEFTFGFDLTQLQSGATKAQALVARSMGAIHQTSAAAFGAAAGAATSLFEKMSESARETAEKVKDVFEQGAGLHALSEQTGVAAGRLYQMSAAFKQTDVDASKLGPAINRLQLHLAAASQGSKPAEAAFDRLGVHFKDLLHLSPDQQFQAIASAVSRLADPAARSASAMGIFGRAGAELLPLFNNAGAVASMGGTLSSQAQVFAQNSEKFHEASESLRNAGVAFAGFYQGLASGLVENFNSVLKRAGAMDFVAAGKQAGEVIGTVIQAFATVWDGFPRVLNYGRSIFAFMVELSLDLVGNLWKGIQTVGDLMEVIWDQSLSAALGLIADLLEMPMTLSEKLSTALIWAFEKGKEFFGNGMWDVIAAISAGLSTSMNHAMAGIINHLPAGLKKMMGLSDVKEKSYDEFKTEADSSMAGMKNGYKADSFGDIEKVVQRLQHNRHPEYDQLIAAMRGASKDYAGSRDEAWQRMKGPHEGLTGMADPKVWHANAVDFWKTANQPAKKPAENTEKKEVILPSGPWAKFWDFKTIAGPHIQAAMGGLSAGAYGYVRHGDAARRKEAEKEAEKKQAAQAAAQAGDTSQLVGGIDGTNERLDAMLGIWGGKGS